MSARLRETAAETPIFVVDDDHTIRETLRALLKANGRAVEDFSSAEDFLSAYRPDTRGVLLVMKRAAQPEEIAPAFVFLAAPSCSSYITGGDSAHHWRILGRLKKETLHG